MKELLLSNGYKTLLDDEDYKSLSKFNWRAEGPGGNLMYARRQFWSHNKPRTVLMHRLIMEAPDHLEVDHINGKGLDNRRANLRLATRVENAANTTKYRATGHRGFSKQGRKYVAKMRVNGAFVYLGIFPTPELAQAAYEDALKQRTNQDEK